MCICHVYVLDFKKMMCHFVRVMSYPYLVSVFLFLRLQQFPTDESLQILKQKMLLFNLFFCGKIFYCQGE